MSNRIQFTFPWSAATLLLVCGLPRTALIAQTALEFDGRGFAGVLHDNVSNSRRQGSGLTPLVLKSYPGTNLYRDDAVGMNFEHIFDGTRDHHNIAMFTPRRDACHLKALGENCFEIHWPAANSKWGMDARMVYDLSGENHVDLTFECTPTTEMFPQGFVAMMWASYMNRAVDRRIHFRGTNGDATRWMTFGDDKESGFEVGTVAHAGVPDLPYEDGSQTLNLIVHPTKKFILPFYYGLLDGDHDLQTTDDRLLYLVLFDQTDRIRFAMWNFIRNETGDPDTHSPAWDWQYVIRDPNVGETYGYRVRIVVKPFEGTEQVWAEYGRWMEDSGGDLPEPDGGLID